MNPRLRFAWILAVSVDALQMGLGVGTLGASTWLLDQPLDLLAMGLLWGLLGWRWVFLPTFVTELLPWVDLAPTWTLAVWIATRTTHPPHPSDGPESLLGGQAGP